MSKKNKIEEGDTVEIINDSCSHGFKLKEIVIVIIVDKCLNSFLITNGLREGYCNIADIKLKMKVNE